MCGHTFQDTQAYKPEELIAKEQAKDPLPKLKEFLFKNEIMQPVEWDALAIQAEQDVSQAVERAKNRSEPDCNKLTKYVYAEKDGHGRRGCECVFRRFCAEILGQHERFPVVLSLYGGRAALLAACEAGGPGWPGLSHVADHAPAFGGCGE